MHKVSLSRQGLFAPTPARRAPIARAVQLACGVALTAALLGATGVQPVAAQDDDTIVLSAGGSTLTVTPGGDVSAVGAVAEAHASPGHARVKAAAAEAIADCEDGALTRGAAALAVAHPDEGALAESAVLEISASNQDDRDTPIRKVVEKKCHVDKEKKEEKKAPPAKEEPAPAPPPVQVDKLPDAGTGMAGSAGLASLLAAASAFAALGAVGFRQRGAPATALVADPRAEHDR